MHRLRNPFPLFLNSRGTLLDAGYIYVGAPGADPEVSPVTVYWDAARTQVAAQPLRTLGGYIVNGSNRSSVYVSVDDYSVRVRDSDGNQVLYAANQVDDPTAEYQPLNTDLTLIGNLDTEPFGRSLLTMGDSAALKAVVGIPDALSTAGGDVSGNITRVNAGPHLYHTSRAMTSGRVFVTSATAADPTSLPGDIWIKLA